MTRNAKDRLAHRGWVALAILGCGAVILIITMLPYHRHKMSATVKAAPTRAEQTEQANQQSTETAPKAVTVDYHIEPVLPSLKK